MIEQQVNDVPFRPDFEGLDSYFKNEYNKVSV